MAADLITGAVAKAAKGSGWTAKGGTLSARRDGIALHLYEFAGQLRFRAKPLVWDEIFWRILGMEFAKLPSPSRHFWGAACHTPTLSVTDEKGRTPEPIAAHRLAVAEKLAGSITLAEASAQPKARYAPDRQEDFVMAEVVYHLANDAPDVARAICEDVLQGRRRSMFNASVAGRSGFFQLAIDEIGDGSFARR